jgi:hypothetical protein
MEEGRREVLKVMPTDCLKVTSCSWLSFGALVGWCDWKFMPVADARELQ